MELIALSGDFPDYLLYNLLGNRKYTQECVRKLIQARVIKRYANDGIKSLRLTQKGKDILLTANPDRFLRLNDEKWNHRIWKGDLATRTRLHRISGAYLMMMEAGVSVHPDDKEDLFSGQVIPDSSDKWYPCFYDSLDIKQYEASRVKGTRMVGFLLASMSKGYIVYNTGDTLMRWSSRAECRMTGYVRSILLPYKVPRLIDGIMLGNGMDAALKLLQSNGGFRNREYMVDSTFQALHFIPIDFHGINMLKLFSQDGLHHLRQAMFAPEMQDKGSFLYPSDARLGGHPVLFACSCDLVRIKAFKAGLELFGDSGVVVCFDFQADVLRVFFGDIAVIRTLDSKRFWEANLTGS